MTLEDFVSCATFQGNINISVWGRNGFHEETEIEDVEDLYGRVDDRFKDLDVLYVFAEADTLHIELKVED